MRTLMKIVGWIVLLAVAAIGIKVYLDATSQHMEEEPRRIGPAPAPVAETLELNESQAKTLQIVAAQPVAFVNELSAVGSIDFNQNRVVQVFTPYQGRIIQAGPNAGEKIDQGQVLFTIDSPDLLSAENTLISSSGVFNLQNKTLGRVKKMESFGGVSQQAVDQSASDQQAAEGALKAARDAVRIFGKTPEEIDALVAERKADPRLIVKSPIDGFVTQRAAAPGLFVQPGVAPAPYTVADLSTMWMLANVPESDAPKIKLGQRVRARVAAYPGRDFEGTITVLSASVDPATRRVFVRSEIADPDHLLRAGMFATFTIRTGEDTPGIAAPVAAVVREGDGSQSIWVTADRRHFTRRTAKVGREQEGTYEIVEGLAAGELVVGEGAVFLSNKLAGGGPE